MEGLSKTLGLIINDQGKREDSHFESPSLA
jgi:hypothetical protein